MSDLPEPPPPKPQLRASDADRERVADLLRHAAGEGRLDVDELDDRLNQTYAAKTRAELEPLTADVVVPGDDGFGSPEPVSRRMPVRRDGAKSTNWVVAIMGGAERAGHWRVGESVQVVSVMGGADLDLNDAELSAAETTMTVWSVMGGSEIYVPEGLNVDVTSIPIMGGNSVKLGSARPDPGGPVLKLRLISIMGGSDVKRGRKRSFMERLEDKRARREERRAQQIEQQRSRHDRHGH